MIRLEKMRDLVDEALQGTDPGHKKSNLAHLYGVSELAALLALQRGLNPELSAICGLLHDMYTCRTSLPRLHDENSAEYMRPLLRDSGLFNLEEQVIILTAIYRHSDKQGVHGPYAEVLKDADILQHYLARPGLLPKNYTRLAAVLKALALPWSWSEEEEPGQAEAAHGGERARLAAIAEDLAGRNIEGVPEDYNYRAICRYWPDQNIYAILKGGWCACFVYHCCMEAGFFLPLRHPLVSMRFAGVGAWLQWAQLPETGFLWGSDSPQRGDIVVFNKILSDNPHDHMGVVLSWGGDTMLVAEGNVDNRNRSGIVSRSPREKVAGLIRIPDGYAYKPGHHDYRLP